MNDKQARLVVKLDPDFPDNYDLTLWEITTNSAYSPIESIDFHGHFLILIPGTTFQSNDETLVFETIDGRFTLPRDGVLQVNEDETGKVLWKRENRPLSHPINTSTNSLRRLRLNPDRFCGKGPVKKRS